MESGLTRSLGWRSCIGGLVSREMHHACTLFSGLLGNIQLIYYVCALYAVVYIYLLRNVSIVRRKPCFQIPKKCL
jgi:hypothetical protein